jgi:hypothetical protein
MPTLVYGALVKVIAGFYLGCMGTVQQAVTSTAYVISLDCRDGSGHHREIRNQVMSTREFRPASKAEWRRYKGLP